MVDCREHLDLIDGGRVCLDVDAGWWPLGGRVRIGAKRSPLRTPEQAAELAREIAARGLELDGLMMYEAQIAGVGDRPANPLLGVALRAMQRASARELAARRAAVVAALPPLRFVNGGGTGSVQRHGGRAGRHRGGGGLRPVRADAVRRLHELHAPPRRLLRAARRAPPGARRGHRARRRLPRLRRRRPRPPPPPRLPAGPAARPPGGRRRGPDAAPRRRPARSATASGSATPRPASCASASTSCTSIEGDRVVDTVPTYRGEGRTFL